jgi:beta-N-acetylglucosaminidase
VNIAQAEEKDRKVKVLQAYLQKYHSPMADNAQDFVEAAEQYELDWRLLPAISGVESTFGKNVLANSYNPFGWGGGYIRFESWRESIYTVAKGISEKYMSDGLDTPFKMQKRYAPPSTTWAIKVDKFMNQIEQPVISTPDEH